MARCNLRRLLCLPNQQFCLHCYCSHQTLQMYISDVMPPLQACSRMAVLSSGWWSCIWIFYIAKVNSIRSNLKRASRKPGLQEQRCRRRCHFPGCRCLSVTSKRAGLKVWYRRGGWSTAPSNQEHRWKPGICLSHTPYPTFVWVFSALPSPLFPPTSQRLPRLTTPAEGSSLQTTLRFT